MNMAEDFILANCSAPNSDTSHQLTAGSGKRNLTLVTGIQIAVAGVEAFFCFFMVAAAL